MKGRENKNFFHTKLIIVVIGIISGLTTFSVFAIYGYLPSIPGLSGLSKSRVLQIDDDVNGISPWWTMSISQINYDGSSITVHQSLFYSLWFYQVKGSESQIAAIFNITTTDLYCNNGTARIIWGHYHGYQTLYGMMFMENGTWFGVAGADIISAPIDNVIHAIYARNWS